MFVAGVVILLEMWLPVQTQQLRVDQHTSRFEPDINPNNRYRRGWGDTSYTIKLVGGAVKSCSVGYAAYTKLKDGDTVDVTATKFLGQCRRIARGDEVLESRMEKQWLIIMAGCLLIAFAIGVIKGDDDGSGVGIRIGL